VGSELAAQGSLAGQLRRTRPSVVAQWRRIARRKPVGAVSLAVIVVVMLVAILAPFLNTGDLYSKDDKNLKVPPSAAHWLGTDEYGRDFYTQMVYGARVTLMVAFLSIGFGTGAGLALGILSGYLGGWVDILMQRLVDIMFSFPTIVLAIAIMSVLGQGTDKVIFAIAVVEGPRTIRVIRGSVLSVRENVYIDAARALGAVPFRIMALHVLPGVMAPYLILFTSFLGSAVLLEASLSFLGLGVPPPDPSWGRFLSSSATGYALSAPVLVLAPGLAITVVVLAFNLLGDALRDIWDPRLRGR
jgi:peptide/nickel transport system permease protein